MLERNPEPAAARRHRRPPTGCPPTTAGQACRLGRPPPAKLEERPAAELSRKAIGRLPSRRCWPARGRCPKTKPAIGPVATSRGPATFPGLTSCRCAADGGLRHHRSSRHPDEISVEALEINPIAQGGDHHHSPRHHHPADRRSRTAGSAVQRRSTNPAMSHRRTPTLNSVARPGSRSQRGFDSSPPTSRFGSSEAQPTWKRKWASSSSATSRRLGSLCAAQRCQHDWPPTSGRSSPPAPAASCASRTATRRRAPGAGRRCLPTGPPCSPPRSMPSEE